MGEAESLDLYLAKLKVSNAKLQNPMSQEQLLAIIKRNAKPSFLFELNRSQTLDEAVLIGRVLESLEARRQNYSEPPLVNHIDAVLNVSKSKTNHNKKHKVKEVAAAESEKPSVANVTCNCNCKKKNNDVFTAEKSLKCFNCGLEGHRWSNCSKKQTGIFCYRCGQRNVTFHKCSNCNKSKNQSKN